MGDEQVDKYVMNAAITAHEVNRMYCLGLGDLSQRTWDDTPQWQKDNAIKGVEYIISNPEATQADQHVSWLEGMLKAGWKWGPVKDSAVKDSVREEHPCCVPYDELPEPQKAKDAIFIAVVRGCIAHSKGE